MRVEKQAPKFEGKRLKVQRSAWSLAHATRLFVRAGSRIVSIVRLHYATLAARHRQARAAPDSPSG
jgi:hypothetical protein